jgi:RHS repeat-associated protein
MLFDGCRRLKLLVVLLMSGGIGLRAQVSIPAADLVSTVAGNGTQGAAVSGVQAIATPLNSPAGMAVDQAGNIYFADFSNNVVRRVTASTGLITTIVGNGSQCSVAVSQPCGDGGLATSASLNNPTAVAVDASGNLYVADGYQQYGSIRYVSAQTGIITTLLSGFEDFTDIVLDGQGNLYISWQFGNEVLELNLTSLDLTSAAGSFYRGYTGDGGLATSANLCGPVGIALDSSGNLFIADLANNLIREVSAATGIITSVAGTPPPVGGDCGSNNLGTPGQGNGGAATNAELYAPSGIAVDQSGNLFIAESDGLIRRVLASTGIINTAAGGGTSLSNNILAVHAEAYPYLLTFDHAGNLYYSDQYYQLVRVIGGEGSFPSATGSVSQLFTSVHPSAYGASTIFTDQISTSGVSPQGTVVFYANGTPIGSSAVSPISATNVLPYSSTFSSWQNLNLIEYANAGTAPDGSSSATKLQVSSGFIVSESTPCSAGAITGSMYAAQGQANPVADVLMYVEFDNSSGTKLSSGSSSVALTSAWQRLTYSATAPAGATSCLFQIWLVGSSLARNSAVSGQTALVWGAQLEQASSVGPYIATASTARSANGGQATLSYADLTVGSHLMTAQYSGSELVAGSTSPFIYQTVVGTEAPTLTLSPTSGTVGSTVTITGSGFGTSQGSSLVLFNGTPATASSWTATSILVAVPGGATTGPIAVNVNGTDQVSSTFTVTTAAPASLYTYSVPTGGYDHVGNLLKYVDSVTGTWSFTYDSLNRLSTGSETAAPVGGSGGSYLGQNLCNFYDSFGNRTQGSFQTAACTATNNAVMYGTNNRITNNLYTYDAAGDVTFDGTNWYAYDDGGRLCAIQTSPVGGSVAYGYLYDAEGRRVAKGTITVTSTPLTSSVCNIASNGFQLTESYVLDESGAQLTTLNQSGTWQRTNVYGGGELLGVYTGTDLHYQMSDPLGTRRLQTSSTGLVEGTYQSLPFGDGLATSGPDATPLHFTGKERDTESGLDYFSARYYASSMGRFMSPDDGTDQRSSNPQSLNRYSYVHNNPLSNVDPFGHSTQTANNGDVLAVYNDGDLGVYQHTDIDNLADYGGQRLDSDDEGTNYRGETERWGEFAQADKSHPDGIDGSRGKGAFIHFGTSIDGELKGKENDAANMSALRMANNSRNGGSLDIKSGQLGDHGALTGYLVNGKYESIESAGNFLAGYNATHNGDLAPEQAQKIFGAYQQGGFKAAIKAYFTGNAYPGTKAPYWGEVPYSGQMQVEGENAGKK